MRTIRLLLASILAVLVVSLMSTAAFAQGVPPGCVGVPIPNPFCPQIPPTPWDNQSGDAQGDQDCNDQGDDDDQGGDG
jgi:hypothetical protein